jgi:hypothetical protein
MRPCIVGSQVGVIVNDRLLKIASGEVMGLQGFVHLEEEIRPIGQRIDARKSWPSGAMPRIPGISPGHRGRLVAMIIKFRDRSAEPGSGLVRPRGIGHFGGSSSKRLMREL